ncbi:MAG TPA: hypothetical protein DIS78_01665 [Lachnospiraceae bacterium]|nr:hypothetical protein [Lachnospiraceae bacterium]
MIISLIETVNRLVKFYYNKMFITRRALCDGLRQKERAEITKPHPHADPVDQLKQPLFRSGSLDLSGYQE